MTTTCPFIEKVLITFWPPSGAANQPMKMSAIAACAGDARAPYKACAGFNNGSLGSSSRPFLKIFNPDLTESEDAIQVLRSVSVYSERRAAAASAFSGNRGYWWYQLE